VPEIFLFTPVFSDVKFVDFKKLRLILIVNNFLKKPLDKPLIVWYIIYMKAMIEINLDNDAFQQNPLELANVLRNLAEDIEYINGPNLGTFIGIVDVNGNTVGSLEVVEAPKITGHQFGGSIRL
jgi:hypothetical protein